MSMLKVRPAALMLAFRLWLGIIIDFYFGYLSVKDVIDYYLFIFDFDGVIFLCF